MKQIKVADVVVVEGREESAAEVVAYIMDHGGRRGGRQDGEGRRGSVEGAK